MTHEELFSEFERLRAERWPLLEELIDECDNDFDKLLADVANLALVLFTQRRLSQIKYGFKPYGEKDSEETTGRN